MSPEKLFALVDLDIQTQKLSNYDFADTEKIFYDLYKRGRVNPKTAKHHRIWVTGLIHKEAYFLIPKLQSIFDNCSHPPVYNGSPLSLHQVYRDMAKQMESDSDLNIFFERATRRINYCSGLDCSDVDCLRKSWEECYDEAADKNRKNELIFALLTVEKAKEFWKQIEPSSEWSNSVEVSPDEWSKLVRTFRDQPRREIGRFYAAHSDDIRYHIAFFLRTLYDFIGV